MSSKAGSCHWNSHYSFSDTCIWEEQGTAPSMLSPIPQLLLCQLSRPTSPASLTSKGTWCSSSACPCKDVLPEQADKIQQMGCLTQNSKDLSPLPSVSYFNTACSTQLAEHSLSLPYLILVNKAMKPRGKEQPPISLFSVLLAPSLLSQQGKPPLTPKPKYSDSLLLPAHTDPPESSAKDSQQLWPTSARPPAHTQGRGSCYQAPVTQTSCAWVGQLLLTPAGG